MNTSTKIVGSLFGFLFLACSSAESPADPQPRDPAPGEGAALEGLSVVAPCTASACGEPPATSTSGKLACTPTEDGCGWTEPDPDSSVSYRACEPSECGEEPDENVCPSGTTFTGAACGSENEGACAWRSACRLPRSTTPCAGADACGDKPEIGVVCEDGSMGDLACMETSGACSWERTCD